MGYVHMPFVTLSQMPELFNSVSVFTIISPTEMTIFVLKPDLWCLVIFGFPKVEAITQIPAFLNVYTEINLPDFKFQPEASRAFALHTLPYHREVYRALESFCGSSSQFVPLSVQPNSVAFNMGSDGGERMLCGFSEVLAEPLSLHRGR